MNVQNITIRLDKGNFEVSYISDSGTLLYDTINLFELQYYINELIQNGSGTGFFQIVKTGNNIVIDKNGTIQGNSILFLTTNTVGIVTIVPLTSDSQLNSTSSYQSKTVSNIVLNPGSTTQTNITFRLIKLGSGTFAGDYSIALNTGNAMTAPVVTDGGDYWNVRLPSTTVDADGTASILITSLV